MKMKNGAENWKGLKSFNEEDWIEYLENVINFCRVVLTYFITNIRQ